ncbi:bifunctional enoyl-CoA hydratase/phosphate acetyltransferase [Ruegeria pomeroyi]|uniref:MaoC family protein/phosphate acetyl/butaryl transferase n=2 Tax=Ruegeria pomeroyi TaxID=89184 RepID=Q5LWR7_RUEPO|nr:bifunctional enoyl-CoA hydratase/phosphate acetyltransferase [Ruegeria pomeroyi]HCE71556.1 phosphate acetyltransferase [Ruegeria sp.]AAV93445.1 maoC family protein/phosphate acetyl/butaryl transferase [Ruegeria pomeroyi DSS-3]NVK99075.1 bifunctional enoyl-CoA hydratase/phosphate acetyltransferase [Ruegeria pomeroyi]NVL03920.1 bifunctional enoyl-CoA hydratase/phosphate acetyltransferase [Ruegeria pomeroyi]QWV10739.1 bifunctional enoyl-CoA hydratase/phosphate acetyltransferase [Ruegeria pomer
MQYIENKTFDEIRIGDSAELTRKLKADDIELFAVMSGDVNPAHVDEEYARSDMFHEVVAHGMWGGALISAVLGTELPGPGTIYLNQNLSFRRPVGLGDTVTVRVTVASKDAGTKRLKLDCLCVNQDGETVIKGQAEVIAPSEKVRRPRVVLPDVHLHERGARYRDLIAATHAMAPVRTAIVHPCDALSLTGALEAASQGLIVPILVAPRVKLEAVAEEAGLVLDGVEIVDVPHSHAAAERAVALVRCGKAEALMKGKLHTDELMDPVVDRDTGLRSERRMSHIFALDVPHYPKPLFVTDAAINIFPDLDTKRDIVQNAIDLAQALGIDRPKVAILSAVETVYPKIPSTIEAAALCKMWDRGQITGGVLDGPLAFDNAVSKSAAKAKGIVSEVAGDADILVVPDLEAGNMIAKQLIHLAGAEAAGIVLGARVPIILTSRADGVMSRLASSAMAQLYIHHAKKVVS